MASKKTKAKNRRILICVTAVILAVIIIAIVVLYFVKPSVFHKFLGTGEHEWSDWTVSTEATCGSDGEKWRDCTVCGEKQTEIINATGNHTFNGDNICISCGFDNNTIAGDEAGAKSSDLSIHFIELGNKATGDCILIDCGEIEVLIDCGSQKNSAAYIKPYLDEYVDGKLDYVIATHSDEDHIAGLIGTKSGSSRTGILYQYEVGTFIQFDKAGKDGNGKPLVTDKGNPTLYSEYLDAVDYVKTQDTQVFTASQCYEGVGGAQRQYFLDENKKISINILYNYYYYNSSADENNYSVVTLLTEELAGGNRNYLFTGDLEEDGESRMVDYYSQSSNSKSGYDVLPEVELYKAGHHGSKTSSSSKLLSVIKPEYVAVCCCAGSPEYTKVDANTFPTQQMIDNVSRYTENIYVTTLATDLPELNNGNFISQSGYGHTSMNGNIVFYSSGGKLKLWCSNNDTILKDTDWFKEHRVWNA